MGTSGIWVPASPRAEEARPSHRQIAEFVRLTRERDLLTRQAAERVAPTPAQRTKKAARKRERAARRRQR